MEQVGTLKNDLDALSVAKAWGICLVASLFFLYEFIQGNMFASVAKPVMNEFLLSADKMTYLSSGFYLTTTIFLLFAGVLLDRYSPKWIIVWAMAACVVSTFVMSFAYSYWVVLLCRLVAGIGGAFCFLGPVRIASRWFLPRQMALVSGVIVTIGMTGGFLAQYPLTKLIVAVGWRQAVYWIAWLGVVIVVLMALLIRDKPKGYITPLRSTDNWLANLKRAYANLETLYAALYTSLMNIVIAVFGAVMGITYLMHRLSVNSEKASFINMMLFLGAIIGGPIMGWLSDRMGERVLPMRIGASLSILTALLIVWLPIGVTGMTVLFFLLGFFTAAQVISYAYVAENNPPEITAMSLSVVSLLTQGGYVLYQNIFSNMLVWHNASRDYTLADYQFAVVLIPLGLIAALWFAKKLQHKQKTIVVQ